MFKLKYIDIGPFRSFVEPQRIDFPENGMVLIEGENGAGKSNILLAIEYAFGSCPFPSTVLGSWQAPDEPPTANLGISDTDKGLVQLNRSKKLELIEAGKTFDGSASQKEEQLLKIIGLSAEVRQALTYRKQRSPGLFLDKTNAEKGDFLVPLLDLIRFEKAQAVGDAKVKELNERSTKLNAAYEAIGGTLTKPNEDAIKALALAISNIKEQLQLINKETTDLKVAFENDKTANKDEADAAKAEYEVTNHLEDLRAELNELQTNAPIFNLDNRELVKISENLTECQKRLDKAVSEENDRFGAWERNKIQINSDIQKLSVQVGSAKELLKRKIDISKAITELQKNICPTCCRQWDDNKKKLDELSEEILGINNKITKINEINGQIEALKVHLNAIPPFEADPKLDKLRTIKQTLSDQLATEKQKLSSAKSVFDSKFAKQIAEVKEKISSVIFIAENVANGIKNKLISIEKEFNSNLQNLQQQKYELENRLNGFKVELAALETQKKQYENSQKQLEQKLTEKKAAEDELHVESDLLNLLGREGFLGSIFDEVLDEISAETNKTLSMVPNTSHVTLEFKSEGLTQKGTVKKSIVPVVTVGNFTDPIKSALSGGMLSSVELAVDLAVMEVVSRRTGVVPGYLMLDEPFTGINMKSKEACFELLKIYSKDRLIIIIDHESEFISLFDKVITVKNDSSCSIVESVV